MIDARADDEIAAHRAIAAKGSLAQFVRLAWPHVESSRYVDGWHIQEICTHLEAVSRVEIRNLVINIPPGCMKSLLTGVFWPVWSWLRDPTLKWIVGSFDRRLVGTRDGGKILRLADSPWFRARWGQLFQHSKPSAFDMQTTAGGFRFATSPRGGGTGRHANIVVIDDPIKPLDASGIVAVTKPAITLVHEWRSQTLSTRQADPATHRNVLVMQRLSFEDPTAETLRDPDVVELRLPMRYEASRPCRTFYGGDRRTTPGALLFPKRFDPPTVMALERKLGPLGTAAQLQQQPQVAGGGIFRRDNWRFWSKLGTAKARPCLCSDCFAAGESRHMTGDPCIGLPEVGLDFHSWDLSFKDTAKSDFVAGTVWRSSQEKVYLRAILNERLSFSAAKLAILRWEILFPTARERILVEDAANGPAIGSELSGVHLVTPMGGKEARAHACDALFAIGSVYLPHPDECPEVWALMRQAEAFPRSLNDDMVDSMTQALVWYRAGSSAAYIAKLKALSAGTT